MSVLRWPAEYAGAPQSAARFSHAGSNLCLDFHGDPSRAGATVLSDGNHHMALEAALTDFVKHHPEVGEVFYTTTPPRVMTDIAHAGAIRISNVQLAIKPDIFIGPPRVLQGLQDAQLMPAHAPFMRSTGIVFLVQQGNPKKIHHVGDLLRDEVRLFLSNPETESVSHQAYKTCLNALAARANIALPFLTHPLGQPDPQKLIYGECIHHREAPQAVAHGRADVAMVYYHLALRYQRIFPEQLELVWPGGANENSACEPSHYHCGMSVQHGPWGEALYQHLMSDDVADIYRQHGLDSLR
ncbi:MAG: molybdate ABC transporter substrate-binding protein [Thiobacillus sp.]